MQEYTPKTTVPKTEEALKFTGPSLKAPEFKLTAGPTTTQNAVLEDKTDAAAGGEGMVGIANMAVMLGSFKRFIEEKEYLRLIKSLEPLKHDPAAIARFEKYVQAKTGMSIADYLTANWDENTAKVILQVINIRSADLPAAELASSIATSIEAADSIEIFVSMALMLDPAATAKLYKQAHPGHDLYTDIVALSNDEFDLTDMANKVFGKVRSNEKVKVANAAEADEASEIIARVYEKYGVQINSQETLTAFLELNKDAPQELKDKIKIVEWTLPELRDLEQSIAKYAPFLGEGRAKTEYYGQDQEVGTIGRLNNALSRSETNAPYVSENIGGMAHYAERNIELFDTMHEKEFSTRYQSSTIDPVTKEKKDLNKSSGSGNVMTHEIGHLLMKRYLSKFWAMTGFWDTEGLAFKTTKFKNPLGADPTHEYTRSMVPTAEAPPTEYGLSNASEDLAESITLYLNNPDILLNGSEDWRALPANLKKTGVAGNPCPKRHAFLKRIVDEWTNDAKK